MPIELDDRGRALENEYFRRREEELIAKMKEKLAQNVPQSGSGKCPKCSGTLYETPLEGVTADVCSTCAGVWLDAGELAQILDKDDGKGWLSRLIG